MFNKLSSIRDWKRLNGIILKDIVKDWKRFTGDATFTIDIPFKLHHLDKGPDTKVTLSNSDAKMIYSKMAHIRRMENACAKLYTAKIIRGFCHLYAGQEAVAVGINSVMRPGDAVITGYRAHGWCWLMGAKTEEIISELSGRVTGVSRGKGGSMHTYSKNFYGGNGIVGAQVPLGTGVALQMKYTGNNNVSFALYGDGAANQGQIFEAYNMAKLWSLPVIYVCENNKYAMGTSVERGAASGEFYTRGDYVPGIQVNGMDVLASREATLFAIAHCLAKKGPIILEMVTYRYFGHSMSDPGTSYRSRDEVQSVRKTKDPITVFKEKILSSHLVSESDIKKLDAEVKAEVDAALAKSKAAKVPPEEELCGDIYKNPLEPLVRGQLPWIKIKHIQVKK